MNIFHFTLLLAFIACTSGTLYNDQHLMGANTHYHYGGHTVISGDGQVLVVSVQQDGHSTPQLLKIYNKNTVGVWVAVQQINMWSTDWQHGPDLAISHDGSMIAAGTDTINGEPDALGEVKVYKKTGTTYVQYGQTLKGESARSCFGTALDLSADGSILVVGEPKTQNPITGAVFEGKVHTYIFQTSTNRWIPKGPAIGPASMSWAWEIFGQSLSISGDGSTLAVGAWLGELRKGSVRVYKWIGSNWVIQNKFIGAIARDGYGQRVRLSTDGSIIAISACDWHPLTPAPGQERVEVYKRMGSSWATFSQLGSTITHAGSNLFGCHMDLSDDGRVVIVGAPNKLENHDTGSFARVYDFDLQGAEWMPRSPIIKDHQECSHHANSATCNADSCCHFQSGFCQRNGQCQAPTHGRTGWAVSTNSDGSIAVVGHPQLKSALNPTPIHNGKVTVHYLQQSGMMSRVISQCVCPNGNANAGSACTVNGATQCSSCHTGYNGPTCQANVCTCSNGHPGTGTQCPTNGDAKCIGCNAGFTHVGHTCVAHPAHQGQNVCICPHGFPKVGGACPIHGAAKCSRCHDGYRLKPDITGCLENVCRCPNGTPETGIHCDTHAAQRCQACDPGFTRHTNGQSCIQNVCTCSNGVARTGALCTAYGANLCDSCHTGFHLDGNICLANECSCVNGADATGANCVIHGSQKCGACNPGYHHNADQSRCEENVCTCNTGSPSRGTDCPTHNTHKCAACTCDHGVPASGSRCPTAGVHMCDLNGCDAGYHFDGHSGQCVANVCKCLNGVAASGAQCAVHDANHCVSCTSGTAPVFGHCASRVCRCGNAVGVIDGPCPSNGAECCPATNALGVVTGCKSTVVLHEQLEVGKTCGSGYSIATLAECRLAFTELHMTINHENSTPSPTNPKGCSLKVVGGQKHLFWNTDFAAPDWDIQHKAICKVQEKVCNCNGVVGGGTRGEHCPHHGSECCPRYNAQGVVIGCIKTEKYEEISRGALHCLHPINSLSECTTAATELALNPTTSDSTLSNLIPRHCSFGHQPAHPNTLKYNLNLLGGSDPNVSPICRRSVVTYNIGGNNPSGAFGLVVPSVTTTFTVDGVGNAADLFVNAYLITGAMSTYLTARNSAISLSLPRDDATRRLLSSNKTVPVAITVVIETTKPEEVIAKIADSKAAELHMKKAGVSGFGAFTNPKEISGSCTCEGGEALPNSQCPELGKTGCKPNSCRANDGYFWCSKTNKCVKGCVFTNDMEQKAISGKYDFTNQIVLKGKTVTFSCASDFVGENVSCTCDGQNFGSSCAFTSCQPKGTAAPGSTKKPIPTVSQPSKPASSEHWSVALGKPQVIVVIAIITILFLALLVFCRCCTDKVELTGVEVDPEKTSGIEVMSIV